jgi:hypothetical protein
MAKSGLLEAKLSHHLTYLGGKTIAGNLFGEEILVFRDRKDYKNNRETRINSSAPEGSGVFVASTPLEKKFGDKKYILLPVKYYAVLAIQG